MIGGGFVWRIRHSVLSLLSVLCLAGCSQRELCYDHPHSASVRIEFDWSEAADAAPSTMVVYFFPADDSQYMRFELAGDGSDSRDAFNSTVKVPTGTYRVVCHNGDTENNLEKGEVFSEYRITSYDEDLLAPLGRSDAAPRPDGTEDQPVRMQASRLWAYTLPESLELKSKENRTVVMKPRRRSAVVNVTIDNVRNMTQGMEFSSIVSGLAESWYPAADMSGGVEVTVPLRLAPDGGDRLRGSMEVFGDGAPHDVRHKFRLYTSARYYYDFDVTDQIHSAPDPYNVDIVLSGLALPGPGEGLDVSVNEWGPAENIDINM